jgi:hypothetical protein
MPISRLPLVTANRPDFPFGVAQMSHEMDVPLGLSQMMVNAETDTILDLI